MNTSNSRVVVGLSGGVDSAVAAQLLLEAGYEVIALFMKNWEEDDALGCAAAEDLRDAESVCRRLGIPLSTVNFSFEYWERVFEDFLAGHRAGRTPNPDILCNKEIKFKEFVDHAVTLGAAHIATGHYARSEFVDDGYRLLKAIDPTKDQSYFLYTLGQPVLARSLFPLGGLAKTEVRSIARRRGIAVHDKRDSTGICFIGERKFKEFLARYLPPRPGEIHSPEGECVGRHDGVMYYTIGQRQGLGIGGAGPAWYVAGKDLERNVLQVVQGHDHPRLLHRRVTVDTLHWVSGSAPAGDFRCRAKTRYRQAEQPCAVTLADNGIAEVYFDSAQRAVTPGQSMVFYAGDVCLGGGLIRSTLRDDPQGGSNDP